MTLGDRIRAARKAKGLTQNQLAEALGLKDNAVSRYEKDTRRPDPDMLMKIACALDVPVGYLLDEPGESPSDKLMVPPELQRTLDMARQLQPEQLEVVEELMGILVKKNQKKNVAIVHDNDKHTPSEQVSTQLQEPQEPEEDIDIRQIPMAAHLEGAESIPLTPELEEVIKKSILEARRMKRELDAQEKEEREKNSSDTKTTT
ncbi:helix-turn-helix domain-containing protein [Desulfotomaculum copahuensis]|uniref:HTH cro/C1-type domain-containing protein n=1 Tax=Desulfotomaculum copahuensis TaxID=1838280 RepID=A0A1B7LG71_9FIRM|nr:helix-turn-helix transcriptional regulator [Desulfotomaculum copahuensis]OAT83724.1 hypothetical protein A6M21_07760 [Desulfotomaculum copahuensis]